MEGLQWIMSLFIASVQQCPSLNERNFWWTPALKHATICLHVNGLPGPSYNSTFVRRISTNRVLSKGGVLDLSYSIIYNICIYNAPTVQSSDHGRIKGGRCKGKAQVKGVASMHLFCCCYWKKVIHKFMIKWLWKGLNSIAHLLLQVTMWTYETAQLLCVGCLIASCQLQVRRNFDCYDCRNFKWHWMMTV